MIERLRLFEEAAEEIEHERVYYRRRSLGVEAEFLREVDHASAAIVESPDRWPKHLAGTRRYVFPNFPFSFVFFEEEGLIYVVALAPHRRSPGYWRKRHR